MIWGKEKERIKLLVANQATKNSCIVLVNTVRCLLIKECKTESSNHQLPQDQGRDKGVRQRGQGKEEEWKKKSSSCEEGAKRDTGKEAANKHCNSSQK